MTYEDIYDLVKSTRSTRRFKPGINISDLELKEIISVVSNTSSAKNMQPLKYITVTNKELVKDISNNVTWAAHLRDWEQKEEEQPSAYIIILNDTNIDGFEMFDCGIALQTILLTAKIKGYDSCPLASIDKEQCRNIFSLPNHIKPILGIALGVACENVEIVKVKLDDTNYYRDENDSHCVPKRTTNEILIRTF